MINAISSTSVSKCSPSFGMAKLNKRGEKLAAESGYQRNEFLNPDMYKGAGLFRKPAIYGELKMANFKDICKDYGCSQNPDANAAFIRHQILTNKAKKLHLDQAGKRDGLIELYQTNYDNPSLSTKDTLALLKLLEDIYPKTEYLAQSGLIHEGTN